MQNNNTDLSLGTTLRVFNDLPIIVFVDNSMVLPSDEWEYTAHQIDAVKVEEIYAYDDGYTSDLDAIYETWKDNTDYDGTVDEATLAQWWDDYKGQIKHKKCICIYTEGLSDF